MFARVKTAAFFASMSLSLVGVSTAFAQPIRYVDDDAAPGGNGLTWATAYRDVQSALTAAAGSGGAVTQIRVAQGLYKPSSPAGRAATFQLLDGVSLNGGYAGTGAPNPDLRNPATQVSTLSGDVAGNDAPNFVNYGDNVYHVVTASNNAATAVIDGFTISGGNANFGSSVDRFGGGILNSRSTGPSVGATIRNCIIAKNRAEFGGGMMNDNGASATVEGCVFDGNFGNQQGGGLYTFSSPSYTNVRNTIFRGNSSPFAGGMYVTFRAALVNCLFTGNAALDQGGSTGDGGGLYTIAVFSFFSATNCTFSGNTARRGGGIHNTSGGPSNFPEFDNCIIWGNTATASGSEVFNFGSSPFYQYSDIKGSGGSGAWVGSSIGLDGGGNKDVNPQFADADGADNVAGTADDNLRLPIGSPAVDAGKNSLVPGGVTTDLDGNLRFIEDPGTPNTGSGTPPIVDMGAYELPLDLTPPVITCPANLTIQCDESRLPPRTGTATATDNRDPSPAITYTDNTSGLTGCNGTGALLRTWRAADAAGNFSTCLQTINIVDTTAPVITGFPANQSLQCASEVPAVNTSLVTATDNCGPVTITHQGDVNNGGAGCTGNALVITRTYRAADACGSFVDRQQVFTIADTTAPTFATFPADANVQCSADVPAADAGLLSASDNCPGTVTITHLGDTNNGAAGCPGNPLVITRTYRATDACGNHVDRVQTFTVSDTTAPAITGFPADQNVQCAGEIPPASTASVTASDNCSAATVTHVGDQSNGGTGCTGTPLVVTRTYRASDACGNFTERQQTFTVIDLIPPAIDTFPPDVALQCSGELPAADIGQVTANDGCPGAITVTHAGDIDNSGTGCPGNPLIVTRTYRVTDACGNFVEREQTFTIADTTGPMITAAPGDQALQCAAQVPAADTGLVTAMENCSTATVTHEGDLDNGGTGCPMDPLVITRFYRASDACGNFTDVQQVFTVADTTAINISGFPPDQTLQCAANVPPANTGSITADDNCSAVSITHLGDANNGGSGCAGDPLIITRTYRVEDACGNSTQRQQTFTIADTTPPVITAFPSNPNVQCADAVTAPDGGLVSATDNCGSVTVTHTGDVSNGRTGCPGDPLVIRRTYRAADPCGNYVEQQQTFTIIDVTAPTITAFPANQNLQCPAQLPAPNTAAISASTNCGAVTVAHLGDAQNSGSACPGNPLIVTRTYRISDACGNYVDRQQMFTIQDTTPPAFTTFPANQSLQCVTSVPAPNLALVTATDNCGIALVVFVSDVSNGGAGCPSSPLVITRTYRATDGCGNVANRQQSFTVIDNTPPVITRNGPATVIAPYLVGTYVEQGATVAETCHPNGGAVIGGDIVNVNMPGTYVVTYNASDTCGNAATQVTRSVIVQVGYVAYATHSLEIKANADITGDVGARNAVSGPYVAGTDEITLNASVMLNGNAFGDSVRVKNNVVVTGSVVTNDPNIAPHATITGGVVTPLPLPVADPSPPIPPVTPNPCNDVTVQGQATMALAAGAFGTIKLKNGTAAHPTVLRLTGGVYHAETLDIGRYSRVDCLAASDIRLSQRLLGGANAFIGPASGSGLSAANVSLLALGLNGNSGALGGSPKAATIGADNVFRARVHVPNGMLDVAGDCTLNGVYIAKWVQIGARATAVRE